MKSPHENIIKEVNTDCAHVSLLPGNIIRVAPFENVEMNENDLIELQKVKRDLVGDELYGLMFVTPSMGNMTKEARELASKDFVNRNAVAKVIILQNLGMRLVANFFVKFNKPLVEHRLFNNEIDGYLWLEEKLKLAVKRA